MLTLKAGHDLGGVKPKGGLIGVRRGGKPCDNHHPREQALRERKTLRLGGGKDSKKMDDESSIT